MFFLVRSHLFSPDVHIIISFSILIVQYYLGCSCYWCKVKWYPFFSRARVLCILDYQDDNKLTLIHNIWHSKTFAFIVSNTFILYYLFISFFESTILPIKCWLQVALEWIILAISYFYLEMINEYPKVDREICL